MTIKRSAIRTVIRRGCLTQLKFLTVHSEIRRYQTTGFAVSKYCNAEVSLSALTHLSVPEGEQSIGSPHSSTGTFGRISLRLCATSKLASSLARFSSTTAATAGITWSRATPSVGLFVLTTSQPVSLSAASTEFLLFAADTYRIVLCSIIFRLPLSTYSDRRCVLYCGFFAAPLS